MRSQTGLPMVSQLGPQEYRDIRPGVFGQQRDKFLAGRIWPPRGEHRCSALPFPVEPEPDQGIGDNAAGGEPPPAQARAPARSEAPRVGKEGVSKFRTRLFAEP